ncbi:hypothetical protein NKH36_26080 [Mesorhizobium sp. M1312]|uniref:hypothetical protein n=1 Tax=unclassified Mesorhizobium TaxID=325217 RepID=UPI003336A1CF
MVTAKAVANPPNLLLENLFTANIIVLLQLGNGPTFAVQYVNYVDDKVWDAVLCHPRETLFASNAHLGHVSFKKLPTATQRSMV